MTRPDIQSVDQPDISACREDFPVLDQEINDHPLVYLDNAASSQMPVTVIEAIREYQSHDHANVHRGVHTLSHRATEAYEGARDDVVRFINAANRREVVYTSGTTEAINLVAQSFSRPALGENDRILITHLEHHSNIVPWQLVCEQTGAELHVVPIDETGEVDGEYLERELEKGAHILAIAHVSNALGTVLPVAEIVRKAHDCGVPVLIDGAQAVPHLAVDVREIDCDFYVFSGHKMFGPTGTGILYAKEQHLASMPPYQGGGDMILEVAFDSTTYNDLPYKFEAGTPNISGAVGLGAAIRYLEAIGMDHIARHEADLLNHMINAFGSIEGLRRIGTARAHASVQSFMLDDIHPHDVGTILDHQGVAIRTGHHCAMPVMDFFGIPGTARASLALYNNCDDVDRLVIALETAKEMFRT